MSWLTEAVARAKSLAQQDEVQARVDKQIREEEDRRAAEQSRRTAEQEQLERERKYAPWLKEVNTLLEGFKTREMVKLGYDLSPIEYGKVYRGNHYILVFHSEPHDENGHYMRIDHGYTIKLICKKRSKKSFDNIYRLEMSFYLLADEKTLFFSDEDLDIRYARDSLEPPEKIEGTFQSPAEFAAFLKNYLMNWVTGIERRIA